MVGGARSATHFIVSHPLFFLFPFSPHKWVHTHTHTHSLCTQLHSMGSTRVAQTHIRRFLRPRQWILKQSSLRRGLTSTYVTCHTHKGDSFRLVWPHVWRGISQLSFLQWPYFFSVSSVCHFKWSPIVRKSELKVNSVGLISLTSQRGTDTTCPKQMTITASVFFFIYFFYI